METIIITLRKEDGQELDLEVPREVCAADLVQELALTFGLSGNFQVFADPPNRLLAPHETLAQASVWDGARLMLTSGGRMPASSPVAAPPPPPNVPPGGPLGGWRPLDLGGQAPPSAPDSPPPSGGFTWKQIDED